jgi:hypothetical protein
MWSEITGFFEGPDMKILCAACGEPVGICTLLPSQSLAVVSDEPEVGGEVVVFPDGKGICVGTLLEIGVEVPDKIKTFWLHAAHCKARKVVAEPKDLFTKETK